MKNGIKTLFALSLFFLTLQNLLAFDGQEGLASWYGEQFNGRLTANGETFDMGLLTAAHKTLPFGTIVLVTNLKNNKSVEVRINDRGPFVAGRIIDLSKAAFGKIESLSAGTAQVRLKVVSVPSKPVIYKKPVTPTQTPADKVSQVPPPVTPTPSPTPLTPSPTPESAILEYAEESLISTATYSIQIGAYSKLDNAIRCKEAVALILAQGSVEIEPAGAIYRVKVTKVKANDLEKTKDILTASGYSNFVVKEEQNKGAAQ